MTAAKPATERRRAKRLPILESFSLFIVVPKKGVHRLMVHDLSEHGMGFDIDTDGELPSEFPVKEGENIEVRFYLNQSLYLPLSVEVVRLETRNGVRRVGAEFKDPKDRAYQGYLSFVKMLDGISDLIQRDQNPPA